MHRALATTAAGLGALLSYAAEPAEAEASPLNGSLFQAQQFDVDRDITVDLGHGMLNLWRAQRSELCLHVTEAPTSPPEEFYAGVRDDIVKSPIGSQTFHDLSNSELTLCIGDIEIQQNNRAYYRPDLRYAALPLFRDRNLLYSTSIEEVRHGWQHHVGLMRGDEDGHRRTQQEYLAGMYLVEGEAHAFTVAVAYEMRKAGDSRPWDSYAAPDGPYNGLITAFEQSLADAGVGPEDTPTNQQMRDAMSAVFEAWLNNKVFTDFYSTFHQRHLTDRDHSPVDMDVLVSQLATRLESLPSGDRPDLFLTRRHMEMVVEKAFEYQPPPNYRPASEQGQSPAAPATINSGPARGPF
ncbi:MAG: hypothetical protein KI792_09050 [Alphaproteobacteria bacterium]|nr:hypothetical protein [Alphaproteobacteria bacterium SS10]